MMVFKGTRATVLGGIITSFPLVRSNAAAPFVWYWGKGMVLSMRLMAAFMDIN